MPTPALLTRTSTRPNSAIAASTSAWQSSGIATSVRTASARRPAASTARRVSASRSTAAGPEHDVGAGLGERAREHRAEAGGGPGDDRHAAVEAEQVQDRRSAGCGHRAEPSAQRSGLDEPVRPRTSRRRVVSHRLEHPAVVGDQQHVPS